MSHHMSSTYKFKKSTWLSVRWVGRRLYVLDRKLLERLMSPSPKSQVMFASVFSGIGDFFRIFGIHIFQVMASKVNLVSDSLRLSATAQWWLCVFVDQRCATLLACLRLDSRYNISLFDSNHFTGDASPLFCAQSSDGKSLPDVHVL